MPLVSPPFYSKMAKIFMPSLQPALTSADHSTKVVARTVSSTVPGTTPASLLKMAASLTAPPSTRNLPSQCAHARAKSSYAAWNMPDFYTNTGGERGRIALEWNAIRPRVLSTPLPPHEYRTHPL